MPFGKRSELLEKNEKSKCIAANHPRRQGTPVATEVNHENIATSGTAFVHEWHACSITETMPS